MPQRHSIPYRTLCVFLSICIVGYLYSQETQEQAEDAVVSEQSAKEETTNETSSENQESSTENDNNDEQQEDSKTEDGSDDEQASQDNASDETQQKSETDEDSHIVGDTYRGEVTQEESSKYRENLDEVTQEDEKEVVKLERPTKSSGKRREKRMPFNFEETPLNEIVQEFAKKRGYNVVMPSGDNAITQKVSLKHDKPISLARAEQYIHLLLELAGYRMHPHGSYYIISSHKPDHQMRKPFPVYVNVPPHELPQSQEDAHAIYSLVNLRVPEKAGAGGPIDEVLKTTLSNTKTYTFDPLSNSIIITDSVENIAATMKIILTLDASDSPEVLQPVQLYNSSAETVAQLLNDQIITKAQDRGAKNQQKLSTGQYFAPNIQVVPDTRLNRLLILGKQESVNRISEFVREYMDAGTETGKSILHVYELQYLDAKDFAPVLEKIVQPVGTQGRQAEKEKATGPTRYFDGVRVIAEPEQQLEAETAQKGTQQKKRLSIGGNRLVVAATSEDWDRIKRIISDLDKPQKQVIIEVMIVDIQATKNKSLGSQTRNPNIIDLPDNVTFQASHLRDTPILDDQQNPKTLVSDLLRLIDGKSFASNAISDPDSGSMLLSISDPYDSNKIWSLFKVLDKYVERKVLSHPFLVTRDNVQAQAKSIDIRRATGKLTEDASQSVSPTVEIEDFKAQLIVNATPRVSSDERLNLQIDIDIEDFIGDTGFDRVNRKVITNANMQTGQVLVLGGLSRTTENTTHRKTPLLGDLPVIGQFFQSRSKTDERTNLVVFLTPTIVEPKLAQGIHRYTNDKIEARYSEAQGSAFENLHQPITRFFFDSISRNATPLDNYLDEVNYKHQQMELDQTYIYEPTYEIMKSTSHNDYYEDAKAIKDKFQSTENPMLSN